MLHMRKRHNIGVRDSVAIARYDHDLHRHLRSNRIRRGKCYPSATENLAIILPDSHLLLGGYKRHECRSVTGLSLTGFSRIKDFCGPVRHGSCLDELLWTSPHGMAEEESLSRCQMTNRTGEAN